MSYHSVKIKIDQSKIHGKGIIAKRLIKKGEIIFYVKGDTIEWQVKRKKDTEEGPNWYGLDNHVWIVPREPADYLNHSCSPNAGIKGKVTVVALQDIRANEEVTIDYSITEGEPLWTMKCSCGSRQCRKVVRSVQFLPKNVFEKYLPAIPKYFQSVYLRSRKSGK